MAGTAIHPSGLIAKQRPRFPSVDYVAECFAQGYRSAASQARNDEMVDGVIGNPVDQFTIPGSGRVHLDPEPGRDQLCRYQGVRRVSIRIPYYGCIMAG